jgi:hypothetical protein
MATNGTLTLRSDSRYKDTPVYTDPDDGKPVFALFEPPVEFTAAYEDSSIHEVKSNEIGMLDMLAAYYYGPGQEHMWWVIALANAIVDPEMEMTVGMKLVIPPRSAVLKYISRASNA